MHGAEWAGSGPRRSSSGRLGSFTGSHWGRCARLGSRRHGNCPDRTAPLSRFAVCLPDERDDGLTRGSSRAMRRTRRTRRERMSNSSNETSASLIGTGESRVRGGETHQSSRFAAWTLREARAETGALAGAAKDAREPAKLALRADTADTARTEVVVRAAILIDVECCTVCAETASPGSRLALFYRDRSRRKPFLIADWSAGFSLAISPGVRPKFTSYLELFSRFHRISDGRLRVIDLRYQPKSG